MRNSRITQKFGQLKAFYVAANQMKEAVAVACQTLRWCDDVQYIKDYVRLCEKAVGRLGGNEG